MGVFILKSANELRDRLKNRREEHLKALWQEANRMAHEAARLGARRVILFGSLATKTAGLFSDLDLLIEMETHLGFIERTVDVYSKLKPRVGVDLLIYTTEEISRMRDNPLIRRIFMEGQVLYEA